MYLKTQTDFIQPWGNRWPGQGARFNLDRQHNDDHPARGGITPLHRREKPSQQAMDLVSKGHAWPPGRGWLDVVFALASPWTAMDWNATGSLLQWCEAFSLRHYH